MSQCAERAVLEYGHAHQPLDVRGMQKRERDALPISMREIDGNWVVLARYSDDRWLFPGLPTNMTPSGYVADFRLVPEAFRESMKAVLYRYLRRGREGKKRPSASSIVKVLREARPFLLHLERLGISRLADTTPMACALFVDACRQHRIRETGKPLKSSFLEHVLGMVEAIYELSQYTDDRMPSPPWPGTSATHLAGRTGPRTECRTPLIPDDVFTGLFQRAWTLVEQGDALLDLRDGFDPRCGVRDLNAFSRDQDLDDYLKLNGWPRTVGSFRRALRELRTACYIVVASLSGCRNHELAFIETGACYSTQESTPEADGGGDPIMYWWMRSQSTKTAEGYTAWMVPMAAVTALRVMERWARPYQAMIEDEIRRRREVDLLDPEIVEAGRHVKALFLAATPLKQNQVRTMSCSAWNIALKAFAKDCGLDWALASHQFRRKFANYAARSQFGDLRYLREHFKHWSLDMTLGYALNQSQELMLYAEIQDELDDIKIGLADTWLQPGEPLAGGYGLNITAWRAAGAVTVFKDHKQMVRSLAGSTAIRSNGHAWCTADDNRCVGNDMERTRCTDCGNAVIGRQHAHLYQGLYDHLKEVCRADDIGTVGQNIVRRDMDRCRGVLESLGYDIREDT